MRRPAFRTFAGVRQSAMLVSIGAALLVAAGAVDYEWAGIFAVPEDTYMWTAQKVEGKYANAAMKMAALPAEGATSEALDALKEAGEAALGSNCTAVQPGDVVTPGEGACFQLQFRQDLWQSFYTIDASGVAAVAFFTEQAPTAFESTAHYLKDSAGGDIEPQGELPAAGEEASAWSEWWGLGIGAAVLVNMITLIGVLLAVPVSSILAASHAAVLDGALTAFSAGALLACAVFFLLFESTHLIAEGWQEEAAVLWRWGASILAGFLLPAAFGVVVAWVWEPGHAPSATDEAEAHAADGTTTTTVGAVTIRDFLHNLCDGLFIGAAFKGCGTEFGLKVSMATVLHELPQELAHYAALTGSGVGLTSLRALIINFASGLGVLLGVVIIRAAEVDNGPVGLILAFGGGVYLYFAAAECMPKARVLQLSARIRMLCLLCFALGTVLIGLILLDHEHCVPEGGSGHSHGY